MKYEERLLRLEDIIGHKKSNPQILPLIPVSRSHWYAGVKKGIYPKQIKIGSRSFWRLSDILNLISELAKTD